MPTRNILQAPTAHHAPAFSTTAALNIEQSTSPADTRCFLCGQESSQWMRIPTDCRRGIPLEHQQIYWCSRCNAGAAANKPNHEEVLASHSFDSYYTHGESRAVGGETPNWLDRLRIAIAWRLDRGKPLYAQRVHELLDGRRSRVVDIGCGSGQLLAELAELGHSVVGVEMDSEAMSRHTTFHFPVLTGTAEKLPTGLKPGSFDCVIMSHVLEHCRQPILALKNARTLLKPGGRLICEVPNNHAMALEMQGCSWEMIDFPRHLSFFTPRSLSASMAAAGFEVKETWFAHFSRQFTNSWIANEQSLWDILVSGRDQPSPLPKRNSRLRAWTLLFRCLISSRDRRYDCVGVMAKLGD